MSELDEKLAKSLTAEDTGLLPYLPYLLQDLWEIGSSPADMIALVKRHIPAPDTLRVLDLACGKGAVSVQMAKALGCRVKGVDIVPEFIGYAAQKAKEYGVQALCDFKTGDANAAVKNERGYDMVIWGAAGDVLGDQHTTLTKLCHTIGQGGYLLLDDAYTREGASGKTRYDYYDYPTYDRWLMLFAACGLTLIEALPGREEETAAVNERNTAAIIVRANELKERLPEKRAMFDGYIQCQQDECDDLADTLVGVTWLLRKS